MNGTIDKDLEDFLFLSQGDRKEYRAMRAGWEERKRQFTSANLQQFRMNWRLPFDPLYGQFSGGDLSSKHRKVFDRIRKILSQREDENICWACGLGRPPGEKRFAAHEFWEWDDVARTRQLSTVHFLCTECHYLTHHAYWTFIAAPNEKTARRVQRFCQVNHCSFIEAFAHVKSSYFLYKRRNTKEWGINYSLILQDFFGVEEMQNIQGLE